MAINLGHETQKGTDSDNGKTLRLGRSLAQKGARERVEWNAGKERAEEVRGKKSLTLSS